MCRRRVRRADERRCACALRRRRRQAPARRRVQPASARRHRGDRQTTLYGSPSVGTSSSGAWLRSIYRRHVEEILRDQPRACRTDASRLGADVAIRMAVTGNSREQMAKPIHEGARTDRSSEDRDWQAYVRRAEQHPFSPAGEQVRLHLGPVRDSLLRIERREGGAPFLRRLDPNGAEAIRRYFNRGRGRDRVANNPRCTEQAGSILGPGRC